MHKFEYSAWQLHVSTETKCKTNFVPVKGIITAGEPLLDSYDFSDCTKVSAGIFSTGWIGVVGIAELFGQEFSNLFGRKFGTLVKPDSSATCLALTTLSPDTDRRLSGN